MDAVLNGWNIPVVEIEAWLTISVVMDLDRASVSANRVGSTLRLPLQPR
jgi:hypothetical protein